MNKNNVLKEFIEQCYVNISDEIESVSHIELEAMVTDNPKKIIIKDPTNLQKEFVDSIVKYEENIKG